MLVVTDGAGPVGHVVAKTLLVNDERVRVIDSDAEQLADLAAEGAEVCAVDLADATALGHGFRGASAIFLALPYIARRRDDFCQYQERVGDAYAQALVHADIRYVVSQSCAGAHLYAQSRLLAGLHDFEEKLNRVPELNVLHLRPAHFLEHLGTEILDSLNVVVGAIAPNVPLPIVFPQDVGRLAAERLRMKDFSGHQVQELLGQRDVTMKEFADAFGRAIGNPALRYVQLSRAAMEQWLVRVGLPRSSARLINEVWTMVNQGVLEPLERRSPQNTTSTSLEAFLAESVGRSPRANKPTPV